MFKITGDLTDLRRISKWIDSYDGVVSDPKTVSAGVSFIGSGIKGIFSSEGASAGFTWRMLADVTNSLRVTRGYPPAHPILVQGGSLKRAAADSLAAWLPETRRMTRSGRGVSLAASATPRLFTAKLSGEKVLNHFGGTDPDSQSNIPARPFFGITDAAAKQAAYAIADISMEHWRLKDAKARKI